MGTGGMVPGEDLPILRSSLGMIATPAEPWRETENPTRDHAGRVEFFWSLHMQTFWNFTGRERRRNGCVHPSSP